MVDTVKITKAPSQGTISAVASKSAAHRLLIAGFMSGLDISEMCKGLSDDVTATKVCLEGLAKGSGVIEMPCGQSASTLRFLIPLASAFGRECDFLCEGRLADRPMGPYIETLAAHGCKLTGHNPKHLSGKLEAGTFVLPGSISSQFITGLLFALPILENDSLIKVQGKIDSRPYVDLSLKVLEASGIKIKEEEKKGYSQFFVEGGQEYALPEKELDNIEGDWSAAAFWIAMDAMLRLSGAEDGNAERISIKGLKADSLQGDKVILSIANQILTADEDTAELNIDVADTPDLVPALAVLACARKPGSVTNITNAGRLRYKESDRLRSVTEALSALGGDIEEKESSLTVRSKGRLTGGEADSFGDHRIAMMAAAAACISEEPVTITGAKAVNKSYPDFYKDYQILGGKLQWL